MTARLTAEQKTARAGRREVVALASRVLHGDVEKVVEATTSVPAREKLHVVREQVFMNAVLLVFSRIPGILLWRQNSGRYRVAYPDGSTGWVQGAPAGASDLIGIVGPEGWVLAIETKRTKRDKLSRQQQSFAKAIHARGGIYVWLHQRSNDLAESVALAHQKFLALLAERRAAANRISQ